MRGRKTKPTADKRTEQLRRANRKAYAKKNNLPPLGNQFGSFDVISGKTMDYYREKHAAHEGTRLEKSIKPPIFLSGQLERMQKEKAES